MTLQPQVENEKKELLLQKFAESADEVRVACSIPGRPLVEAMREKRTETATWMRSKKMHRLKPFASFVRIAKHFVNLRRLVPSSIR